MVDKKTVIKIAIVCAVGVLVLVAIALIVFLDSTHEDEETRARKFMADLNELSRKQAARSELVNWAYESNITDENEAAKLNVSLENAKSAKEQWQKAIAFKWQDFKDENLKRQFKFYTTLGNSALPERKYEMLEKAITEMEANYATAKICAFRNRTKCDLSLEPEITKIFETSNDIEELNYTWVQWHEKAGRKSRKAFMKYVELSNEAAVMNNYTDQAHSWIDGYEEDDFEQQMEKIWNDMKPLYLQMHAYVRKQLYNKYGNIIDRRGPIPTHLMGNVWAQSWSNLLSFTLPYPERHGVNLTSILLKKKFTPLKIFQTADDFFRSLNLTGMPKEFWNNSILTKPKDGRELVCHASAWDFYNGDDFRIKQCTEVDQENFETAHHEMGHVEYFIQYKDQPFIFRDGANPGFHEAIGDVIALSATTPKHLHKIGLLDSISYDPQSEINHLFKTAMDKVVFLPFAFLIDAYRYRIFRGQITPDDYNCKFWQLKEKYQGVEPPVKRTEADFDAAAKYHVAADVEYARYFVSFIIQFQFHQALCEKAGEYVKGDTTKKLTDCDIYGSAKAGNALGDMLRLGSSVPWQDAMEKLTGQRSMNASGILEYFKPLQNWLERENKRTGEYLGWEKSKVEYCSEYQLAVDSKV